MLELRDVVNASFDDNVYANEEARLVVLRDKNARGMHRTISAVDVRWASSLIVLM